MNDLYSAAKLYAAKDAIRVYETPNLTAAEHQFNPKGTGDNRPYRTQDEIGTWTGNKVSRPNGENYVEVESWHSEQNATTGEWIVIPKIVYVLDLPGDQYLTFADPSLPTPGPLTPAQLQAVQLASFKRSLEANKYPEWESLGISRPANVTITARSGGDVFYLHWAGGVSILYDEFNLLSTEGKKTAIKPIVATPIATSAPSTSPPQLAASPGGNTEQGDVPGWLWYVGGGVVFVILMMLMLSKGRSSVTQ